MAGAYLQLRGELEPAVKGAWGATVGWPQSPLAPENSPVAGRDTPPMGRVSGSKLSRAWVVFEPPPLPATESEAVPRTPWPGYGIQPVPGPLTPCTACSVP